MNYYNIYQIFFSVRKHCRKVLQKIITKSKKNRRKEKYILYKLRVNLVFHKILKRVDILGEIFFTHISDEIFILSLTFVTIILFENLKNDFKSEVSHKLSIFGLSF